jgi:hypothetical protein
MVLPTKLFIVTGRQAAEAVSATPLWSSVILGDRQVARPQEGLIVIAYTARAERQGEQFMKRIARRSTGALSMISGGWFSISRRHL